MNLTGSIDLLKLRMAGTATIKGKKCIVIPVDEADIYVSTVEGSDKPKAAYVSINVSERREVGKYGHTHYSKQVWSKAFKASHPNMSQIADVYLGDFKPNDYEPPKAEFAAPPVEDMEGDDLPF